MRAERARAAGADATARPQRRPRPRPRVAHVVPAPEFVQKILVHDLRRLRDRMDVTIVCPEGEALATVRAEGFRIVTLPLERKIAPIADLASIWRLWRLIRRERFDVVHSYLPKGGLLGQLAAALAGVPLRLHSCRGLLYTPAMPAWRRRLFRITDRLTNRLAQRTLYVSGADAAFSTAEGLCAPGKACCTGNAIDLSLFDRARVPVDSRARLRAELGIADDAPIVLTAGRYVEEKGYVELATAITRIRRTFPSARFVWVAPVLAGEEGVLRDSFLAERGIVDIVRRLGLRSDMPALYAMADVVVHPSHREGVPRVLMEAAAIGVPVAASDIPGCREVVTPDETGLLFPVGDADALAAAVERLLGDEPLRRRLARAGQARARDRFDQNTVSARVWTVYEQFLGSHGR